MHRGSLFAGARRHVHRCFSASAAGEPGARPDARRLDPRGGQATRRSDPPVQVFARSRRSRRGSVRSAGMYRRRRVSGIGGPATARRSGCIRVTQGIAGSRMDCWRAQPAAQAMPLLLVMAVSCTSRTMKREPATPPITGGLVLARQYNVKEGARPFRNAWRGASLKGGDQGVEVRKLQQAVVKLGHDSFSPDRRAMASTRVGVKC